MTFKGHYSFYGKLADEGNIMPGGRLCKKCYCRDNGEVLNIFLAGTILFISFRILEKNVTTINKYILFFFFLPDDSFLKLVKI